MLVDGTPHDPSDGRERSPGASEADGRSAGSWSVNAATPDGHDAAGDEGRIWKRYGYMKRGWL